MRNYHKLVIFSTSRSRAPSVPGACGSLSLFCFRLLLFWILSLSVLLWTEEILFLFFIFYFFRPRIPRRVADSDSTMRSGSGSFVGPSRFDAATLHEFSTCRLSNLIHSLYGHLRLSRFHFFFFFFFSRIIIILRYFVVVVDVRSRNE